MKRVLLEEHLSRLNDALTWRMPDEITAKVREGMIILDVRERHEFESVRIVDSLNLPRGRLELEIGAMVSSGSQPLLIVCKSGVRASLAAHTLGSLGYTQVSVLKGGLDHWIQCGKPTTGGGSLSEQEFARYDRHLSLPGFTPAHQGRLKSSTVLVIGCGGLGSPVIAYLAAAGVGRLRLVDFDRVDASNLQRQVIHRTTHVGQLKVDSAKAFVTGLNPEVTVEAFPIEVTESTVHELMESVDIVVDGSDRLETRYLLNRCCVQQGIPYVYGAVFRNEGEFALFGATETSACYQCLHPKLMPRSLTPSCSQTGVIGVVPGFIGMMQANLVLNYLLADTHAPEPSAELVRIGFDGFRSLAFVVDKNEHCEACSCEARQARATH
ncbi:MAG: ThiF family adenylyltransferase [Bradymonadia bacterium]